MPAAVRDGVPASVSAFSEKTLERIGANDPTGIQGAVPNLNLVQGRGSSDATNIYIRGVGQPDALQTFDPAVGVYVDDVYYSRIRGTQLDLFDISRLEVLRGPQGTLYGKNTIGGALKIVTRKPGQEKRGFLTDTAQSVAESLAGPQTLMGPMIHSACVESWDEEVGKGDERRMVERRREFILTAMPEQLKLTTDAAMEERARGLHKVNTYNLKANVMAQWGSLASLLPQSSMKNSRMHCGAPIVMMAVGDARGIRTAQVTMGSQALALKPGTFHPTYSRGLHAVLPESVRGKADGLTATLDLELVGTERLAIVPLGGNTEVLMTSSWPHPSFAGRFLPSEREVKKTGFSAQWRLSSLATTAQADIANGKRICLGAERQLLI